MSEVEGERVGTISMVYDHNQRGLVNSLLDVEHEFSVIIRSSIHVHIGTIYVWRCCLSGGRAVM